MAQSYSPGGANVHPIYRKPKKWLPWQRPSGGGYRQYLHSDGRPLKTPSITSFLVAIVHTKTVNSNFCPKIGCHGNVPQYLWTPIQHIIPTAYPSPHPKRHPYRFSRLCTDDCRVSLYFTMGCPFSPKNLPLPMGGSGPSSTTWFPGPTQVLDPNGMPLHRFSRFCRAH